MSAEKRHTIGNLLFWFQIACAVVFCTAQAKRMLTSTQGVSFSFFVCHGTFSLINLSLSLAALKGAVGPDRKMKQQTAITYGVWVLVTVIHITIAWCKMDKLFKPTDYVSLTVVALGVVGISIFAKAKELPLLDPYVKAAFAIFFKSVPQAALAVTIYYYGKGGLSGWWILIGHVTINTRLIHLWISSREKWDRNTKGSFVSEIWNEISWLAATLVWLKY